MTRLPRVLIVDDTPDLLRAHIVALEMKPAIARVEGADNGAAALDAYALAKAIGDPFDLLILDLAMPGMNGFHVAEKIRDEGDWGTKIVFFTSYDSDMENEPRAKACGALGVWGKQDVQTFREEVRGVLIADKPVFKEVKTKHVPEKEAPPSEATRLLVAREARQKKTFLFALSVNAALFAVLIGLTLFNMARAPRVYSAISSIDKKLDGAVSTKELPAGYRVYVPAPKTAYKKLADGSVRVTFQFEPKDAAAAESLADARGVPLYLNVTRGK